MTFGPDEFVGGALCLDFANTVGGHRDGEPKETLHAYSDLLEWAAAAGAVPKTTASQLADMAKANESRATRALVEAKKLRETIFEVFVAVADRRKPPSAAIAALNEAVADAYGNLRLRPEGGAFELGWAAASGDLRAPLWPVVKSAVDLLVDTRARLHECESDTCGWLFIDQTKNRSRRWCSMKDCGNRAKVRRFRAAAG